MEYVKWKKEFSVENELIDGQHKELFRLINAFYNNIKIKSAKEATLNAIIDMENYIHTHFADEEAIMSKVGYKYLPEHIKEHQVFIENVADFKNRYMEGRLLLSLEVSGFIKTWITQHILIKDQMYKEAIR